MMSITRKGTFPGTAGVPACIRWSASEGGRHSRAAALIRPFDDAPTYADLTTPPHERVTQTFCGT